MTLKSEVMLGDIAEFIRGINFKPDDVVSLGTEGSVGCMRTKNVQDELDCSDVWAVPKAFVRREEQMLAEGDILVSSANSWNLVGKCSWIPRLEHPSSFGGFVSVLRAKPEKVEPSFLYRWFSWGHTQALLRSFGQKTTNISNLNIERCLNMKLNLPPLPEQRRIAAILDQADVLRAKRREALAQLDSLTQSIFIEMFGEPEDSLSPYKRVRFDDVCTRIFKGAFDLNASDYQDEGIPFIRISNIRDNSIDLNGAVYINETIHARYQRSELVPGDIVFSKVGTIDRIGVIPKNISLCNISQNNVGAKLNRNLVEPDFAISQLTTPYAINKIKAGSKKAVQDKLVLEELRALPFVLPPVAEQRLFVAAVSQLKMVKASENESAKELDTLFTSLQHRAFRGEL